MEKPRDIFDGANTPDTIASNHDVQDGVLATEDLANLFRIYLPETEIIIEDDEIVLKDKNPNG